MTRAPLTVARAIDSASPRFEARPSTADEFAEVLRAADADGLAVAPVGGGTQLDLGNPPTRVDLLLETSGLNRVVEYEPADLTVTVEAGMRFADLQALLGEQGQFLALDPAVAPEASIGGVIATNASGPLRFAHGTARDLVIGTRVANPDGTLTRAGGRVVKNVAGYDLNKLYIGSLGTLAVLVELSFKLAPLPPATDTIVGQFEALDQIRGAVRDVLHSALSPLAIEVVGSGAAAMLGLHAAPLLAIRVGGYPRAVERQARDLSALVAVHRGNVLDAGSVWDDLAAMRREAQHAEVVLKAAAPISESVSLVGLLEARLAALSPTIWAHAGSGVAYAACSAPSDPAVFLELRARVGELGENASLVVQRCPTPLKAGLDVWGDAGPSLALMRALKAKLDPNNTLNPGRYVGRI